MMYHDWKPIEAHCIKCAQQVQLKGKFPYQKPGQALIRCVNCGIEKDATVFFADLAVITLKTQKVLDEVEEPGSSRIRRRIR